MRTGLLALLLVLPAAGCIEMIDAGVPQALLDAHGWRENTTARQSRSEWLGLARADTRAYEDRAGVHPGRLWVYTLKAPVTPDEEELVPKLRERVEAEAERQGIAIAGIDESGARTVRNGARATWFAYNGSSSSSSGFVERNAEVHIFGEVWPCREARTIVVVVGIAQVADARTYGGLLTQPNRDPTTWNEIVADPSGTVGRARGTGGLAWNIVCV